MKRLISLAAVTFLLPLPAQAQTTPPAAPGAPVEAPPPPLPPIPSFDLGDMEIHLEELHERMGDLRFQLDSQQHALIVEQAALAAEQARAELAGQKAEIEAKVAAEEAKAVVLEHQLRLDLSTEDGLYNAALVALQRRQYDRAVELFERVLTEGGSRADAAIYWKAFSEARLVRTEEALATLATLQRDYPESRYLDEARGLEADIRSLAGQNIDPQTLDANDEIKLIAINGIARTDPDRAIPLLESVLDTTNTLGNKKRALFVLALSDDPRARDVLLRYARGAGNPELQVEAIRSLGSRQGAASRDVDFREIYAASQDAAIKHAIIDAYARGGNKASLMAIIGDPAEAVDLKRSAVARLGNLATAPELWSLYQQEASPVLRAQIVSVLASAGAVDQLVEIARIEQDASVRLRAMHTLGRQAVERTGQVLLDFYRSGLDRDARLAIVAALRAQNNAEGLVAIAREESNLEMKRSIVSALSALAPQNQVAADYLMEIIQ